MLCLEFLKIHDKLNRRVVQLNICDLPDLPVRCGSNIFFPGCKKCSVTFSGGHWKLRQCGQHFGSIGDFSQCLCWCGFWWILTIRFYPPIKKAGDSEKFTFQEFFPLHGSSNPTSNTNKPHQMHFELIMFYFDVMRLMRFWVVHLSKVARKSKRKKFGGMTKTQQ